jgi:hypothetical protein
LIFLMVRWEVVRSTPATGAELVTLDAKLEKVPGLMCTVRNLRN